jgi:hypothetical protein
MTSRLPPEIIAREREHLGKDESAPLDGLSLSGGGVRSATVCYGVLRRLVHHETFAGFSHLATVSGGGYIGSCLMALLKGHDAQELAGRRLETHLRSFGRYLIPRQGFLGRDGLRILGALFLGLAWTTLWFAGVFVLFTSVVLFVIDIHRGDLRLADDLPVFVRAIEKDTLALVVLMMLGVLCAALSSLVPRARSEDEEEAQRDTEAIFVRLTAAILVCIVAELALSAAGVHGRSDHHGRLLGPPVFMLGAFVCAFVFATYEGRRASSTSRSRSFASTMLGMWSAALALAVVFSLVPTALYYWKGADMPTEGTAALGPTLGAILIARFVAMLTPKVTSATETLQSLPRRAWAVVFPILPAAALACALALSFVFLAGTAIGSKQEPGVLFLGALALVVVLGVSSIVVDANRISPHVFYRDRIADAFLRLPLKDADRRELLLMDAAPAKGSGPVHVILAALNTGSSTLARRGWRSVPFELSPFFVGSQPTGWLETFKWRDGSTTLASAVAISGAAASSGMGFYTTRAQAFALTLFNVRLGQWLRNPLYHPQVIQRPFTPSGLVRTRTGHWREGMVFWPHYLAREALASTRSDTALVNLSDGGHTGDNLGLLPLLRRRCRFVLAVDAAADEAHTFDDLASAIRLAHVEEGATIDIELADVRLGDARCTKGHWAVGKITYRDGKSGWLLYLKSSCTGDESESLRSYRAHNPAFPHEPTADQFFSDAQFDAYLSLGEHVFDALADELKRTGSGAVTTTEMVEFCDRTWRDLKRRA